MLCCMRGLKQMKSIELCAAPCCPGYKEVEADPPNLTPMVWCEKDPSYVRQRKVSCTETQMKYLGCIQL